MLKYHVAVCDDEKSDLDGIVQSVQRYDAQGCFDIETYMDGDPVVDALLNYYLRIAERNYIKVKLDVTIPEVLTISSLSLSIIIGNTFDNAIEACCDLPAEQRIIHLQLRKQYRSLFYRLENPYSDTVRSIRIGEYHGYGLKNINRIVQENHGDFYTKKKDGVFTVQVRLNCEN